MGLRANVLIAYSAAGRGGAALADKKFRAHLLVKFAIKIQTIYQNKAFLHLKSMRIYATCARAKNTAALALRTARNLKI